MTDNVNQDIHVLEIPNSALSDILQSKTITLLEPFGKRPVSQSDFLHVIRRIHSFRGPEQPRETSRLLEALELKGSDLTNLPRTSERVDNDYNALIKQEESPYGPQAIISVLSEMLTEMEAGNPNYSIDSLAFPELFLSADAMYDISLQANPILHSLKGCEGVFLCRLNLYTTGLLKICFPAIPIGRLFWNKTITHWLAFMDLRGNLLALRTNVVPTIDMPHDAYYMEYFAEGEETLSLGNFQKYFPEYVTDLPPFDEHKCLAVLMEGAVDSIRGIEDAYGNLEKVGKISAETILRDDGEPLTAPEKMESKSKSPPFRILHQVTNWDSDVLI